MLFHMLYRHAKQFCAKNYCIADKIVLKAMQSAGFKGMLSCSKSRPCAKYDCSDTVFIFSVYRLTCQFSLHSLCPWRNLGRNYWICIFVCVTKITCFFCLISGGVFYSAISVPDANHLTGSRSNSRWRFGWNNFLPQTRVLKTCRSKGRAIVIAGNTHTLLISCQF